MANPGDVAGLVRTVITELWPYITLFAGAFFTERQNRKQAERQSKLQREQGWRERQLSAIDALQKAVTASSDGIWQASLEFEREIRAIAIKRQEASSADQWPVVRDFANEPWHREWRAANDAVVISSSRLDDQDLDSAVSEFVRLCNSVSESETEQEVNARVAAVQNQSALVLQISGKIYRQLDKPMNA